MQKRRYADTEFGQIHYRIMGSGPNLILLHQSPRSSREYEDIIAPLAQHFTVYAPDTPGNGMSDPLTKEAPTMLDYGDAVIAFMDSVGIQQARMYGFHTGGSICTSVASRYPDRITKAIANGLCILDEAEKQDLLTHYCPEITPALDGSHLAWLWQRIRIQAVYFPWYKEGEAYRLDVKPYAAEKCQTIFEDFILAGNNYIAPYEAAFAFNPLHHGMLPSENLMIVVASNDPLLKCLDKLPHDQARRIFETHEDATDFAFDYLKSV